MGKRSIVLFLAIILTACSEAGQSLQPIISPQVAPTLTTNPSPAPARAATTIASPTANPSPTPARALTVGASPTLKSALTPQIVSFTVTPTTTLTLGERISFEWQAVGDQAALCPFTGFPGDHICVNVPLSGTMNVSVDENALRYHGYGLRVTVGQDFKGSVVDVHLQCRGFRDWFFPKPPERCPEAPPLYSAGAAERFEHGLMIWIKSSDTSYVFYDAGLNDRTFETFVGPLRIKPGGSVNNRSGETQPPGLYEPVSGFGLLWREEAEGAQNIRRRLGWAIEKEFAFDTAYQCEPDHSDRLWRCYLLAPNKQVLRLHPDSSAQAHFVWEEY